MLFTVGSKRGLERSCLEKLDTHDRRARYSCRLYKRYANTAGFPDVRPLLDRLGVEVEDGEVQLRPRATVGRDPLIYHAQTLAMPGKAVFLR